MKDITVTPFKTINISHRVYFFRSRNNDYYAICSLKGLVTLLDKEFNQIGVFDCSDVINTKTGNILIFVLHPTENVFGIGSEDEYRIYDFQGNLHCSIRENIEAIYYSPEKNLIWEIRRIDSNKKEICLKLDHALADRIEIEDELYESAVHFQELPDPDKICMMLLAGQDGAMTYVLTNENGKINYSYKENLDENALLDLSPDGEKLLSVNDTLDMLSLHAYPEFEITKEFALPEQYEEDECQFEYNDIFIDNKYALIEMGESMHYILDTDKMDIIAHLTIEGHEPKPVSYYWPSLKNDESIITNLSVFFRTPQYLIASFKATPKSKDVDSLVIIETEKVKDTIKANI